MYGEIWLGLPDRLVHVSFTLFTIDWPAITFASSVAWNVSVLVEPFASVSYVAVSVLPPERLDGTTPAVFASDPAT